MASMKDNLEQCRNLVQKAATAGAKVSRLPPLYFESSGSILLTRGSYLQAIFLPEASDYIASSAAESVSLAKSLKDSEFVLGLQDDARKSGLEINVGVHEPADGGKKVKNTLLWIDGKGDIVGTYRKIHLFDVNIKDGPMLRESDSVEPGNEIVKPFDTSIGKVGLGICFDVRTVLVRLTTFDSARSSLHPSFLTTDP